MLDIISSFLPELEGGGSVGRFGRIDGGTKMGERQRIIDDFNREYSDDEDEDEDEDEDSSDEGDRPSTDKLFGLLLSTKTGGVGVNLTGANRIIIIDPGE